MISFPRPTDSLDSLNGNERFLFLWNMEASPPARVPKLDYAILYMILALRLGNSLHRLINRATGPAMRLSATSV